MCARARKGAIMAQRDVRRKRRLVAVIVIVLVILTALAVWKLTRPKERQEPLNVMVWIYDLDQAERLYGGPKGVVKKLKDNGAAGLIVCTARDGGWFNDPDMVKELFAIARKNDLKCHPYMRFLAENTLIEETYTGKSASLGADGLIVFNLETEYETGDGAAKAEAVLKAAQDWGAENDPGLTLAYSSFGLESLHPKFPGKAIRQYCGLVMPKWYTTSWRQSQGWDMEASLDQIRWEYAGRDYPIAPVLQAYGKKSGFEYVPPSDLKRMLDFSSKMDNVKFISVFRMELMDEEHWQVIHKFTEPKPKRNFWQRLMSERPPPEKVGGCFRYN